MSELELDLYMPLPFPIKPKYHLQKLDLSSGVPFSSRVARMEGFMLVNGIETREGVCFRFRQ